jgi:hypothetical protein
MPLVVYFMLFISQTCEIFTDLHYNITEVAFEQEYILPPVKVVPIPLQPQAHSILKCPIIHIFGVLASRLSKDKTGESLIVQGEDCRVDVVRLFI